MSVCMRSNRQHVLSITSDKAPSPIDPHTAHTRLPVPLPSNPSSRAFLSSISEEKAPALKLTEH